MFTSRYHLVTGLGVVLAVLAGSGLAAEIVPGVPAPTDVPGKEYSHHLDINAATGFAPMQNLAWDGTGACWDTFNFTGVPQPDWQVGTNVDAIANIQDRFFKEVVNDQVALLVTIDYGVYPGAPVVSDFENIYFQTAGANPVAGIWAHGVIPAAGGPPTSDIHTAQVQARWAADPQHTWEWINPTGIEVWGSEVEPPLDQGMPGTGDDAQMFSTNADAFYGVSVFKYHQASHTVTPYIMQQQIAGAIGLQDPQIDPQIDLDGMMIFDQQRDDEFGPGDSIMFTVHGLKDPLGNVVFDGGEIWVWNFDDGPLGTARFLVHGGQVWDTAHAVGLVFGTMEEDIGGLEAVPEPASQTLLAFGALALLRRRKARA